MNSIKSSKELVDKSSPTLLRSLHDAFTAIARHVAAGMGSPWAFLVALSVIGVWTISGPFLEYSDTWQLVINTGTTIVTFLMVFLIHNSQNRDGKAIQLKLDELIRAIHSARNEMIETEFLTDDQLKALEARFRKIRSGQSEDESGEPDSFPEADSAPRD